ncbi:PREDICTED: RING-H2 finger protein ATL8 [Populus euphratica]|uniref:RING-H2 finger protein ATL8 n=1 Tax=Populus euphratica TaxID=75702 RepID=A0AAJ6V5B7_POPEU|nr:PREDICTED: RING-H2 finger protein ATL8 [Populus euphratica]
MTRPFRLLNSDMNSSATTTGSPPQPPATLDPDFMVILAALLCALICVLGLIAVARCAWLRRLSSHTPAPPAPLPPPSVANKGLKKKTLRSLPKQTFSEDSAGKSSDCAICLTEFSVGDEIRVLPQCGHGFHVACIDTWLGSHSSCPSCRQILMVARCQKCGGLPSGSSSISGGGGAETEAGLKESEDVANRFLP